MPTFKHVAKLIKSVYLFISGAVNCSVFSKASFYHRNTLRQSVLNWIKPIISIKPATSGLRIKINHLTLLDSWSGLVKFQSLLFQRYCLLVNCCWLSFLSFYLKQKICELIFKKVKPKNKLKNYSDWMQLILDNRLSICMSLSFERYLKTINWF